jgi:aspartyl-tRNA(Asn)/glutamyl-tRNA(Gln) amidotransferase subunit B
MNTGQWEVVIGLETHTQLATQSKIFSGSSTHFGADPNTQASVVDCALPGVLPVMNKAAVECAIKFGLAIGAVVAPRSIFARKNYFYPDLPKGYQISQFEIPVVQGGSLQFSFEEGGQNQQMTVQLTRAHLEEDAGKSLHENFTGSSGIDLNRAGTPLLEIVTEPDMRSAKQAVAYAKTLHGLVTWLGICDGNLQEGSFRCDANVSVRRKGSTVLGTRCEIKNLNSFRFLERAIDFEVRRQIELIEDGGTVVQETRLYDSDKDETRSMRTKEDAHDYRYFPDPDLPPLVISEQWIATVKAGLPELPAALREKLTTELGLSTYDAGLITSSRSQADYFAAALAAVTVSVADRSIASKLLANWINGELSAQLNRQELDIEASPIKATTLAALLARVHDGTISNKGAKELFLALWAQPNAQPNDVDVLIKSLGLKQVSDSGALQAVLEQVIAAQPAVVADYLAGKESAFNSLMGQVMKASKGKANPQQVSILLKQYLDAKK